MCPVLEQCLIAFALVFDDAGFYVRVFDEVGVDTDRLAVIMHAFKDVRADYFDQMLGESKIPDRKRGGRKKWTKKSGARVEALDCENYALHAARVERIHLWGPDAWEAYQARLMQTDLLSSDEQPVITEIHTDRTVDADDLELPQAEPEPNQADRQQPAPAKPLQPTPEQPQPKPRALKPRSLKPRTRSQTEPTQAQPKQETEHSKPKTLADIARMMRDD
ncbi:terminase gpA endonuclease subunit [Oceanospirillum maris]|uniref:terminase gpA endonuclease subunit n=1 Tax=Oceanospirillum maris TaxID=64977 RepID=UPI0012FEDCB6|nr:terminase gpA endonuclease subunit [Oceanospirillum maris]